MWHVRYCHHYQMGAYPPLHLLYLDPVEGRRHMEDEEVERMALVAAATLATAEVVEEAHVSTIDG